MMAQLATSTDIDTSLAEHESRLFFMLSENPTLPQRQS